MFSFRSDKTGFFVTIILLVLLAGAVVGTVVVLALGHWETHKGILKIIWGAWWVLCIITVLVRLAVFRWQMSRGERACQQSSESTDGSGGASRPEAEGIKEQGPREG